MGKSAGKWIKTLLFGKKHSKSNYSKGELKSAVEDPARDSSDQLSDRGVTCACQCDAAVGVAYVDQGIDDEEARRQEAEYDDAILVSSKQKLPLIDDRETSIEEENTDTHPSTSYIIVPSKSNAADVALPRLKPKSSVSNLVFKLTPSMLHGQALGSIELLLNFHKFESGAGLLNTHHSTPQDQGKIDETCPPSDPKNLRVAFRMSVLEDYVDSDDDVPSIGGSPDSKEEAKFFEPIQPKLKSHSDLILSNTMGESPPPESHYEGEGSSRGHRRTRAETDESEMEEMNRRMDDLQVTVQELKNEYTAHRLEDLLWRTDQSAHWANYYAHRQEDLHHMQEQREEDRAWRAQQNAHWDTYHANQQAEQEWRQEMYNARLAQTYSMPSIK